MQQIERVGVIALLLMVVTIVVVAMWDDEDESSNQVQASVSEENVRQPNQRAQAVSGERQDVDEVGLRSTRPNARQRTTAPTGAGTADRAALGAAPDDGNVRPPRTTDRRAPRHDPARLRASERPRVARTGLSVPEPESELEPPSTTSRTTSARTASGQVANGITFGERRRNETARTPNAGSRPGPPSTVRPGPAREPSGATAGATYVVKSGDSLERIARRVLGKGSRWRELQALNGNVDPLKLYVGMKLELPSGAAPTPRSTPAAGAEPAPAPAPERGPAPTGSEVSGRVYVVQAGDILGRIAQRELGSAKHWRKITELNPKVDPGRLLVGARLVLPDVGEVPSARASRNLVAQADASVDSTYRVR